MNERENIFNIRLDRLLKRRIATDNNFKIGTESILLENINKSSNFAIIKYINLSCEEVEKKYTEISFQEGERVKNQLLEIKNVEFEYQGSVSNNTHIKYSSDLDLLILYKENHICSRDAYHPENSSVYLIDLKDNCQNRIKTQFPQVKIERKAKVLKLTGGSLKREIDVVPAYWHNPNKSKAFRGIKIYDEKKQSEIINTPFYHNLLLETRDEETRGYYKKGIRLIKNIKFDLEDEKGIRDFKLSSYDIIGLLYQIPKERFDSIKDNIELTLFLARELNLLLADAKITEYKVPDGSRRIISNDKQIEEIRLLKEELLKLYREVDNIKNIKNYTIIENTPKAWGN